ncbi:MAG: helix-turn-helix transcriptional regulator [Polaromonas sp.]|nr:helix-turn-helix transcriptional regulator [Polaromonas sp.]
MNAHLVESFGITVRRLREGRGWSQEELAGHADLNRSYVGEIERGQVIVSLVTIQKLSSALGLSAGALMLQSEQLSSFRAAQGINLMAIAC